MKYISILLIVGLCTSVLFGQEVTFNIIPQGGFIRINGKLLDLSKQSTIQLSPGTYNAEIWVPQFAVTNKEFEVKTGAPQVINYAMRKLSDDFNDYREELSRHKAARLKRSLTDGAVIGTVGGLAYFAVTGKRKKLDELQDLIENRRSAYVGAISVGQIQRVIEQYDNAVAEFESVEKTHNSLVVGAGTLTVAGAGLAVLYFKNKNRAEGNRPVYAPDNPFLRTGQIPQISLHLGTSTSLFGLTLKF